MKVKNFSMCLSWNWIKRNDFFYNPVGKCQWGYSTDWRCSAWPPLDISLALYRRNHFERQEQGKTLDFPQPADCETLMDFSPREPRVAALYISHSNITPAFDFSSPCPYLLYYGHYDFSLTISTQFRPVSSRVCLGSNSDRRKTESEGGSGVLTREDVTLHSKITFDNLINLIDSHLTDRNFRVKHVNWNWKFSISWTTVLTNVPSSTHLRSQLVAYVWQIS